jgi:hypothetical protein
MSILKEQHRRKLSPRVSSTKEETVKKAAEEVLAGQLAVTDVQKKYKIDFVTLQNYIRKEFPTDVEKYDFLENVMQANAMMAAGHFADKVGELSAIDAARAANMFANTALSIKKAREDGFKERPISIGVLINLEKTLKNVTPATVTINE